MLKGESMKTIESVRKSIMEDPDNIEYTKKGWEPIFMASPKSKLLIIGQAPGIKTQEAVLPLDFYFPGKGKSGDLPPRKDFAAKWHPLIISMMPHLELTLLVGSYAQKFYLKDRMKANLTDTVKAYRDYLPDYFPLVHPSPLNVRWFKNNPDFEEDIVPQLKLRVEEILSK